MAQDHPATLVVPVVKDVLQNVGITAGRNRFEERASRGPTAALYARSGEHAGGALHDMRLIEHETIDERAPREYLRDQGALATADVDDEPTGRKIVRGRNRAAGAQMIVGHGAIHALVQFGMLSPVLPGAHSEHMLERCLTGHHAVSQILPGRQIFFADEHGAFPNARIPIGQQPPHRRHAHAGRLRLYQTDGLERAQEASQRRQMRTEPAGEKLFIHWSGTQLVDEAQLKRCHHDAGCAVALDQGQQACSFLIRGFRVDGHAYLACVSRAIRPLFGDLPGPASIQRVTLRLDLMLLGRPAEIRSSGGPLRSQA